MGFDDELWGRLLGEIRKHTAGDAAWRAGVDRRDIERAEARLGVRLPPDYAEFLMRHDGQDEDFAVSILSAGGRLAPLEAVVERHAAMSDWHDDEFFEEFDDKDRVRAVVSHTRRIDIGGSVWFDYDNTVLDLIPGPAGTEGQVLAGISEFEFVVVGESFTDYLRRVVVGLEEKLLTFRDDGPVANLALAKPTKYQTRCERAIRSVATPID